MSRVDQQDADELLEMQKEEKMDVDIAVNKPASAHHRVTTVEIKHYYLLVQM